ncbi:DUF4062 domain-containing protein [Erwinia billingiae]|uniref:DUF4062 domain-containing protein n=1 Tax=Erwinia billingiae TaxID=182337 RepID=UPI00320A1E93
MDKRYQVFVSSTYTDLKDERHSIMLTLMKMDCIPSGMEHFPAADEEQWNFIKRIIDFSDYYLLIIGGRYGSLDDDGLSFTEKEYDYAVSKNLKVVALIHGSPEKLSYQNSEQQPELREKLEAFRDKVKTKRLVEFWTDSAELPGKVALGIMNAKAMYPAIGWVRADKISNESSLIEINELRKENKQLLIDNNNLKREVKSAENNNKPFEGLASIDSEYTFSYSAHRISKYSGSNSVTQKVITTWREIFHYISPKLTSYTNNSGVKSALIRFGVHKTGFEGSSPSLNEQDFYTMAVQFQAYELIKIDNLKTVNGSFSDFWILTPKGKNLMLQLRVITE